MLARRHTACAALTSVGDLVAMLAPTDEARRAAAAQALYSGTVSGAVLLSKGGEVDRAFADICEAVGPGSHVCLFKFRVVLLYAYKFCRENLLLPYTL